MSEKLQDRKYDPKNKAINYGQVNSQQDPHNIFVSSPVSAPFNFPNTSLQQSKEDEDMTYKAILNSMVQFRKVDKWGEIPLKLFDTPSYFYFKIFFYFGEDNLLSTEYDTSIFPIELETVEGDENTSNSINKSITNWKLPDAITYQSPASPQFIDGDVKSAKYLQSISQTGLKGRNTKNHSANTAFNYLLINQEYQRAEKLLKFIHLLQDISVNSPWYFRSITGLSSAVERKDFDKEFKVDEDRKELTIKCLADAFDTRIGTLLDLYRDIVASYEMHKEIVPANLRKFNMGVYLFETPNAILFKNAFANRKNSELTDDSMKYMSLNEGNTKYLEFHNCEIDYNSSKSGFDELNNEEPYSPEYTITIRYDAVYEERYNNILNLVVGDFYKWDIFYDKDHVDNDNFRKDNLTGNVKDFNFTSMIRELKDIANEQSQVTDEEVKRLNAIASGNLYKSETIGQMLSKKATKKLADAKSKAESKMMKKVFTPVDNAKAWIQTESGNIKQKIRTQISGEGLAQGWALGKLWEKSQELENKIDEYTDYSLKDWVTKLKKKPKQEE